MGSPCVRVAPDVSLPLARCLDVVCAVFSRREDLVHPSRWTASESHVFVPSSPYKTHRNCRPRCTYTVIGVELNSPRNARTAADTSRLRCSRPSRTVRYDTPIGIAGTSEGSTQATTVSPRTLSSEHCTSCRIDLQEYLETRSSFVALVGCAFHKHQPRARDGCPRSSFYRSVQEGCARLEAAQQGRLGRWWRRGRGLARRLHRLQRPPLFFVLV